MHPEQLRIALQTRFERRTEKFDVIDGQLSPFDKAKAFSDSIAEEPAVEEVVESYRRRKQRGKRVEDLKGLKLIITFLIIDPILINVIADFSRHMVVILCGVIIIQYHFKKRSVSCDFI